MQRFTTRKNQEEHGPEVKKVWRNHQKTISRWRNEPNQTSCKRPPPPAKSNGKYFPRVFHVVIPDPPNSPAVLTRHSGWQILGERAGWSAVWYSLLTGWEKSTQFKLKMVSDVLLLSYLDKIWLFLLVSQGELWRIYIVKRGYIREPGWRVFLSRLPHVLQGQRKSTTATHVEQWVLCSFPLKITAALSLHFQHLNED